EIRHGIPIAQRHCRVALDGEREPGNTSRSVAAGPPSWRGDVESPGFPFALGALSAIRDGLFDFDDGGERILVAGQNGLLHSWRIDGAGSEMLPRALFEGRPLTAVEAVVGVAGGFVVAGRKDSKAVAAHYDFRSRVCTAHDLMDAAQRGREWTYL